MMLDDDYDLYALAASKVATDDATRRMEKILHRIRLCGDGGVGDVWLSRADVDAAHCIIGCDIASDKPEKRPRKNSRVTTNAIKTSRAAPSGSAAGPIEKKPKLDKGLEVVATEIATASGGMEMTVGDIVRACSCHLPITTAHTIMQIMVVNRLAEPVNAGGRKAIVVF
jgi:hypothetical protein